MVVNLKRRWLQESWVSERTVVLEMARGKELVKEVSLVVGLARRNVTIRESCRHIINVLGQHQEGVVVLVMTRGRELVEMVSLVMVGGSRRSL